MIQHGENVPVSRSSARSEEGDQVSESRLEAPDDPVQDGVGSSGIIGGVSQRGVSSKLAQATLVG